jgi:hypothetical protein
MFPGLPGGMSQLIPRRAERSIFNLRDRERCCYGRSRYSAGDRYH